MTNILTRIKAEAEAQRKLWESDGKRFADIVGREWTAEETEQYERVSAQLDVHERNIGLLTMQRDVEQRAIEFAGDLLGNRSAFGNAADLSQFAAEIRNVLNGEQRGGLTYVPTSDEVRSFAAERLTAQRALSVGVAAAGGNAVGASFLSRLIEPLRMFSGLYAAGAFVMVTEKGESVTVPRLASFGSAGAATENTQLPGTDPSFGQITFGTKKYGDYLGVSNDLITDALFDIEGFSTRIIGENLAVLFGQDLATGSGTNAPQGIANASTLGVTGGTGVGGAPTWDNLIDLQESVAAPYQPNASWVVANSAVSAIRKLKDNSGRYYWEPNGQAGEAPTLLGRPLFRDPFLAGLGVGNKPLFYGDFTRYWVRVVGEVRVERSDQALFGSDQTAFRGVLRGDGRLMDASAVRHFQGGAS